MDVEKHKSINGSDDDTDYELPSLSDRIQTAFTPRRLLKSIVFTSDDSDDDKPEFLKVSKKMTSPPSFDPMCDSHSSRVMKYSTPLPSVKHRMTCSKSNISYSNLKYKSKNINQKEKVSDSDEEFSNIIENIRISQTPVMQNKQIFHRESNSDSEEEFSNIIENLHKSQTSSTQKQKYHTDIDSDNDEFSNIIENICKGQTPISRKMHKPYEEGESYNNEKLSMQANAHSLKIANEEEYATLFPPKSTPLSSVNQAKYSQMLFKFFNEKIFNSQLDEDMPVIWSNALLNAAGKTFFNGIKASIKLSPALLTTFERLENTLLHEMCHAAVFVISKARDSHGSLWQTWASRCTLILPFVKKPVRCHDYELPYRIQYQCLTCDWKKLRIKASSKYQGKYCRKCKTPIVMKCI